MVRSPHTRAYLQSKDVNMVATLPFYLSLLAVSELQIIMNGTLSIYTVAVVEGTGGHGTVHLMNDGYIYFSHSATPSAQYFRCKKYRVGCPGRVIFYSNGLNIQTNAHNHDSDGVAELMYRANHTSLLNRAVNSHTATFEDVFHDLRNANQIHTLQQLQRLMPSVHNIREWNLPPCPTLRHLSGILRNPDFAFLTRIHQSQEALYQGSSESSDQSHVVLFMSEKGSQFLRILPSVSVLHIPPIHQQSKMYVVAGMLERSVMALAWILCDNSTYEALCAGFQLLKSKLVVYSFSQVISAADTAGFAFSQVFGVEFNPSLYDYINDMKSSENTGLTQERLQNNHALRHIVGLCCALPLLPGDKLQIGINIIIEEALLLGNAIYHAAVPVFHFIEEKWLKIPYKNFSMCTNVDRTNYGCEELRSRIFAAVHRSNIGFYSMIRNIVALTIKSDEDVQIAMLGHRNRHRQGQIPLLAQTDIQNLLQNVIAPPFNVKTAVKSYLMTVAMKLQNML